MKKHQLFLAAFLVLFILPIFATFAIAFTDNKQLLASYTTIISDSNFTDAFNHSMSLSLISAMISVVLSFTISLSYYKRSFFSISVLLLLIFGFLPPDIISLSLSSLASSFGFHTSNLPLLVIGLVLYTFPFGVVIFWIRYYFIDPNIFKASRDIGLSTMSVILKILLPLSKSALFSCFTLTFLLSFNEYPRTFYLSGGYELLSEYFNVKLNAGADSSTYAGSSISILVTTVLVCLIGIVVKVTANYDYTKTKTQ